MVEGVLEAIVEARRCDLDRRFDGVDLDSLRARAEPSKPSFADALAKPGSRFVLEIKKRSPSAGAIRRCADVEAIAEGYCGVADALSVLVEERHFGGSTDDVQRARRRFGGPILAKDFFIDRRQVVEARIAGADAILVMLSVVDDPTARALIGEARRFGMDALVEVHDEAEMRRANALGAEIIGINNRDLRDLSIDLSTTERLAPLAGSRLLVSESGISARADIDRLAPRVDAFLVGSALMREADPAGAARALIFGRVKLCGINRQKDFEESRAATHAGYMFVPESPRFLSPADALRLSSPPGLKRVGIFRNAPVREVAGVATMLGLDAVQLHGDEAAGDLRALARRLPPDCEIWKSVTVADSAPGDCQAADRLLFDSGPGGTGHSFDWSLIADHPRLSGAFLAGGIGPGNARAAASVGAFALDIGSAVDERPGTKSPEKIAALFDALRAPSRERLRQCA